MAAASFAANSAIALFAKPRTFHPLPFVLFVVFVSYSLVIVKLTKFIHYAPITCMSFKGNVDQIMAQTLPLFLLRNKPLQSHQFAHLYRYRQTQSNPVKPVANLDRQRRHLAKAG